MKNATILRLASILLILTLMIGMIPAASASNEVYFPVYMGNSSSIVDALRSLDIDPSYQNRERIAAANGIPATREPHPKILNYWKNSVREFLLIRTGNQQSLIIKMFSAAPITPPVKKILRQSSMRLIASGSMLLSISDAKLRRQTV